MAIDGENSVSLPVPPPPRPAARRAAIEMALRKFDGIEEPVPSPTREPRRFRWASLNRRPAGALVAVAIMALISVPAIQIALRDNPPETATESAGPGVPVQIPPLADSFPANEPPPQAPGDRAVAAAEEAPGTPPPAGDAEQDAIVADRKAAMPALPSPAAPSPMAVIAAPPSAPAPPPPPPPPPPAGAQAETSDVGSIVVSGSRIPANSRSSSFAQRAQAPPSAREIIAPYGEFLNRLQDAFGGNDRRGVVRLVAIPLRVNFPGGARTYRSRQDVERDYDRIFTPAVRQAAQNLYAGDLASRDGGRLRGGNRIWFGCGLRTCSSEEVIRVREITP